MSQEWGKLKSDVGPKPVASVEADSQAQRSIFASLGPGLCALNVLWRGEGAGILAWSCRAGCR